MGLRSALLSGILEARNPVTSQPSGLKLGPDLGYDVPALRRCCGIDGTGEGGLDEVVGSVRLIRPLTSNRAFSLVRLRVRRR